jgi:hypothetical protein
MDLTASKTERGNRRFWIAIVTVSVVLLLVSVLDLASGDRLGAPHSHLKQVLSGVIVLLVCITGFAPRYAKWLLGVATLIFLAGGFWLGWT